MSPPIRITTTLVAVLEVFLADPQAEQYGLDVMRRTDLPSGTVYPILSRLLHAGWLDAQWENVDPASAGRPARRWYRLTTHGAQGARDTVDGYHRRHAPRRGLGSMRPTWES